MNDLADKRREKLMDAVRKAAQDLLNFENVPIAGFSFPLDDSRTTWVIVRPATEAEADAELTKK